MKSIKTKLSVYFGTLIIFVCLALGAIAYYSSNSALSNNAKEMLSSTSLQAASVIESRLDADYSILETISQRDEIRDLSVPLEKKAEIVQAEAKRTGFTNIGFGDTNGDAYTMTLVRIALKERPYYQEALKGNRGITDPIISKADGNLIINMAVPIKDKDGKVIGVLIGSRNAAEISQIISDITVGKTGKSFIINNLGVTVAHYNKEFVEKSQNIIEEAKKDPTLQSLADVQKEMIKGNAGTGEYVYQADTKYLGYAPIKGTNWIIGIAVPRNEVLSQLNIMKTSILIASIIIVMLGLVSVYMVSRLISTGISKISSHLQVISKGDFTNPVSEKGLKYNDGATRCNMKSIA